MNKKYIIVREAYDWIGVGSGENELSIKEYKNITVYLEENYSKKIIDHSFNKFRFINYVGIIALENIVIEILPKISLTNDKNKDREVLLIMLEKCKKLNVILDKTIKLQSKKSNLLEILGRLFVKKLYTEIKKGIYCEYINVEENINSIKGKLMLSQHIRKNPFNKTKAYCSYDEFTEDNILNRILKMATIKLMTYSSDGKVKKELEIINNILDGVSVVNNIFIDNFKFNRQNTRFKEAYNIAKLILSGSFMKNTLGNIDGFTILFEMHYLFEEYIGVLVSEILNGKDENVVTQEKGMYLLKNSDTKRNQVALRPDIVVYKCDEARIIIDTKWKSIEVNGRETYSQGDIYQMYAYITRYTNCQKCILLYPKSWGDGERSQWELFGDSNKKIFIREVALESMANTINELKGILSIRS